MADKTTAKEKQTSEKDLQEKLAGLRTELIEQVRSIKTGTATNVRVAAKTRKEIARTLTALNQTKKEGERN